MALPQSTLDNVRSVLTNPGGTFRVAVHNRSFSTEAFTSDEADLFVSQYDSLISGLESSMLTELLSTRSEAIARGATYAKHELGNKVFGGVNAGDNEIGFSIMRPGHVRADADTGDTVNDWYYEADSSGWNDWIGDGSANNYALDEDQVNVSLAFLDQDVNTEVSAININEFGRNMDMLPYDLNEMRLLDNDNDVKVQELPTMVASDRDTIHARLRYDRPVESQPRLFGVTFGMGSYLNAEDF